MLNAIIVFLLFTTGCVQPAKKAQPNVSVSHIAAVAIGTDKADVLKTYGAPLKIEIIEHRFKYTYVESPTSKITIYFDQNHKVSSIEK